MATSKTPGGGTRKPHATGMPSPADIQDAFVKPLKGMAERLQNLPLAGADLIDISNGTATNLTKFNAKAPIGPNNLPPLTSDDILHAYAVKHNPFAYFRSIQESTLPESGLNNMVGFDGPRGLFADLGTGDLPAFSYIVPNQCDDQHGQNNADAFCTEDQGVPVYQGLTDGTQVGLNPGLSANADTTIQRLVTSIKASPAWHRGSNAIVVVWDENDYSGVKKALPAGQAWPAVNLNRVVLTVENNSARKAAQSNTFYDSYSLLKSMEAAFRLPCLNHACDKDVSVMSDLFVN